MDVELRSSAFKQGEMIPRIYTCDGENISPPLDWDPLPPGTVSLGLICEDPDAPMGTWVHWIVYCMRSEARGVPENIPPNEILRDGCKQGTNDFRRIGYGGPCSPKGTHRYFFRLYALDKVVTLPSGATKDELLKAMEGHIIATGTLMGLYSR